MKKTRSEAATHFMTSAKDTESSGFSSAAAEGSGANGASIGSGAPTEVAGWAGGKMDGVSCKLGGEDLDRLKLAGATSGVCAGAGASAGAGAGSRASETADPGGLAHDSMSLLFGVIGGTPAAAFVETAGARGKGCGDGAG